MKDIYTYAYVNRDVVLNPRHQRRALPAANHRNVAASMSSVELGMARAVPRDAFKREDE